jgi:hypothetical protein
MKITLLFVLVTFKNYLKPSMNKFGRDPQISEHCYILQRNNMPENGAHDRHAIFCRI